MQNECSARIMVIQKSLPEKKGDYSGGLPVIGIFIGCALCICTVVSGDSASSVGIGIVSLLAVILISFIIGAIMDKNVET